MDNPGSFNSKLPSNGMFELFSLFAAVPGQSLSPKMKTTDFLKDDNQELIRKNLLECQNQFNYFNSCIEKLLKVKNISSKVDFLIQKLFIDFERIDFEMISNQIRFGLKDFLMILKCLGLKEKPLRDQSISIKYHENLSEEEELLSQGDQDTLREEADEAHETETETDEVDEVIEAHETETDEVDEAIEADSTQEEESIVDEELEEYEEELENELENELESDLDSKDDKQLPSDNRNGFKQKKIKSVVDDEFFSLQEMENFVEMSEAHDIKMANKLYKKMNGKEGDADADEQEDSDDSDNNDKNDIFSIGKELATGEFDFDVDDDELSDNTNDIRYKDFFEVKERDAVSKKTKTWRDRMPIEQEKQIDEQRKIELEEELEHDEDISNEIFDDIVDQESDQENKILSSFEKEQQKIANTVKKLEDEIMAEKEWVLKGEVSSKARPVNSLLEHHLDVDIASKPIPIITEETTKSINDIIIQRIKDAAFDDVVRQAPPKNSVFDPNRRWELDDEKSKMSLGEIYEEQYQKAVNNVEKKSERTLKMEKDEQEIQGLITNLFQNLDALSNFYYTPPPAEFEVQVIPAASVPAISLEEMIPANVSKAKAALAKEVYDGKAGKAQNELEKSEKKNLRISAKRKRGAEKKSRSNAKAMRVSASGTGELQHQISKKAAIKKLMGQKNVTMVVGSEADKKKMGKGDARFVQHGGSLEQERKIFSASHLKL